MTLFLVLAAGLLSVLPHLADIGSRIGESIADRSMPAYDDCRALRGAYPDGVGTPAAVKTLGRVRHRPASQPAIYRANRSLDTDGDGIACERGQRPR